MSPLMVRAWHLLTALSVVLVSLLLLVPLVPGLPTLPSWLRTLVPTAAKAGGVVLAATLLVFLGQAPTAVANTAGTPDPALLAELEQRLLEPPKCMPGCASFGPAILSLREDSPEGAKGGRCECGAAFVVDETGRSGGLALIDAQTLLCDGDTQQAMRLETDVHVEVKTRDYRATGAGMRGHSYLRPKIWFVRRIT